MEDHHYLVPIHNDGVKKNLEHSVTAATVEDAEEWFVDAKNRLLDINHWEHYDKHLGADFQLTDSHGKEVNRRAHRGDHMKVDVPGPHPQSQNGHDWVVIEAIEYDDYPDEDRETLAMRIRPSSDPHNKLNNGTPLCPDPDSTTFVIERLHKRITALYHHRSSMAKVGASGTLDCDSIPPADEWLGLNDTQWAGLIKSLLV